jgi:hypothetical protein
MIKLILSTILIVANTYSITVEEIVKKMEEAPRTRENQEHLPLKDIR